MLHNLLTVTYLVNCRAVFFKNYFTVVQVQLSAFTPHRYPPPQPSPPPSPASIPPWFCPCVLCILNPTYLILKLLTITQIPKHTLRGRDLFTEAGRFTEKGTWAFLVSCPSLNVLRDLAELILFPLVFWNNNYGINVREYTLNLIYSFSASLELKKNQYKVFIHPPLTHYCCVHFFPLLSSSPS